MSLRLRLLTGVLRRLVKPGLRHVPAPKLARASFERSARLFFSPAPFSLFVEDSLPGPAGPIPALWCSSGPAERARAVLYLHGGGYVVGSPQTHQAVCSRLSRLAGVRVLSAGYRLAPEHPFPGALEDAAAAFEALLGRGYSAASIVIGGDSAGGGLALALLARLCAAGRAPAGVFAWSPWTDLTLSGDSLVRAEKREALLPLTRIKQMRDYYAGDADLRDPGLSPLSARFPSCPPVLIQYSLDEILADDGERMATALRAQGAAVRVETWAQAPHVWQMYGGWLPEAQDAIANTADFVRQALDLPPRPPDGN